MNVLDIIIIATICALLAIGFFAGIGRIFAGLLAVYFSTIASAAFYQQVSDLFRDRVPNMEMSTADLLAFVILFGGLTALCFWVVTHSSRTIEHRRGRFAILDNIGGAALGIIVGALTIALTLSVTVILLGALNQSALATGNDETGALARQIQDSALVPLFLELQPTISASLQPWFPDGLPAILQPTTVS